MAREVVEQSRRFLVHSNFAAGLARLDATPEDEAKIGVLPFGHPPPEEHAGTHREEALVATFGLATPVKRIDLLIDAFQEVVTTIPSAKLAVVGDIHPASDRDRYQSQVERAGLTGKVDFVGRVDRRDYRDFLRRATVAIQLRSASYGENSGAVADCLASGIPTIVSALGAARELPGTTVVKVGANCTATQLGGQIIGLVRDEPRRRMLSDAALAYAQANSFATAAEALFGELLVKDGRSLRRAASA